ncbi:MAG: imidazole glycerol phosphate synthase subunit HisF [Candidatus Thermoplasmatota archaeon]|nr:imidazole glycerol phosphate synthase subunit HisF [Candidatus Thermoplasmatota archaeon]
MVAIRIIPCLDIKDGSVVKGKRFVDLRDAGDPVERASKYYKEGADELFFRDISATDEGRKTMLEVVKKISRRVFIPLTVGGGIGSVDDVRNALAAGADKVAMTTAALKPELIKDCVETFGSQCTTVSIDAKRIDGSWHAFINGGKVDSGRDAFEWAKEAVSLGAGELLLNSIDMDGTQKGYDVELTRKVAEAVSVPVIASGGAGNPGHILKAIKDGRADGVLIASILHHGTYTTPQIKEYLNANGVLVRS